MKAAQVSTLVRWLRRTEDVTYRYQEITLENFFKAAYYHHYGVMDMGMTTRINYDLTDMEERGIVPIYVVRFMKDYLYPILRGGSYERRMLDVRLSR